MKTSRIACGAARAAVAPAVVVALTLLAGAPLRAQTAPDWQAPGDIDGLWDFATATPLQRPSAFAEQEYFTVEEAGQFERDLIARRAEAQKRSPSVHAPYWLDHGRNVQESRRTSLVVDPPNGRIPALTEDGQRRARLRGERRRKRPAGPEDRSLWERCLMGFNAGPPMNPGAYNNNVLILVTPDTVALLNEMVHETRIVPLRDRPGLAGHVRQFKGDSRGRWEGETLVVETRNFDSRVSFQGSGGNMELVERFTRQDETTLIYEYTMKDPESFVRPWSARLEMKRSNQALFEYACHEGNHGLANILEYARTAERETESVPPQ